MVLLVVLGGFGWFWVVLGRFGWFCWWFWVVLDGFGSFWVVLGGFGWFRVLVTTRLRFCSLLEFHLRDIL